MPFTKNTKEVLDMIIKKFLLVFILFLNTNALAERYKYALEKFDVSELALFNTRVINNVRIATIIDNEGYLYTVIKGDCIGKNYGMVTLIRNNKIKICDVILSEKTKDYVEECYWLHKKP
jgi:Tfp pilus assembly protein PilP